MQYDGNNPLHVEQARTRLEQLIKNKKVFELTEKKPKRTGQQNRYLHVILGFFACETGNTLEWVKQQYFKKLVNPAIFIREKEDKYMGKVKYLRSSADLDATEMSLAIDRWRNWCSMEAGIYIPNVDDYYSIQLMEVEIKRNEKYL